MRYIFVRCVGNRYIFCSDGQPSGSFVEPGMKGGGDYFSRSLVLDDGRDIGQTGADLDYLALDPHDRILRGTVDT